MDVRALDIALLQAVNGFAGRWPLLDLVMTKVVALYSVKTLPLVLCIVWLWFLADDEDAQARRRNRIASALLGMFLALVVSRVMQNLMPHLPRPMHTAGLDLITPIGASMDELQGWSSFPSDHAAMSLAISYGIWRESRKLGILAFAWAILVICLPRVYSGFHFPSDLIAGGLIGVACVYLVTRLVPRPLNLRLPLQNRPYGQSIFYTATFAILFWIATMFGDVRSISKGLFEVAALGEVQYEESEPEPEPGQGFAAVAPPDAS